MVIRSVHQEAELDKRTEGVIGEALKLPDFERSYLVRQLLSVLDGGGEKEVLEAALALPEEDRWELVDRLLPTLDDGSDTDLHPSWDEEIARRVREIESGQVKGIPWSEVRKSIRRAARGKP